MILFAWSSEMLENLSSIPLDSSVKSSSMVPPSGVSAMLRLELAANALNSLTTLRGGEEGAAADPGRGGIVG